MYAILDIETTGGKFNEEGITEIAIHKFDGHKVIDSFISLVNPEKEIQPFVVNLTGINNKMLRTAPKFHEVAKRIVEITEDTVIVAHNAQFDYRILRTEFRRLGYNYQRKSLCTVDLSKALLPDADSYSLGKLVRSLGIPVSDRHRANGDALATVKLFKLLLAKDSEKAIIKEVIRKEAQGELSDKQLDIVRSMPNETGVFYMHGKEGDIIYLSKSTDIKKRVNQLFTKTGDRSRKLAKDTKKVTFEKTGSELVALLKEHQELLRNRPKYNAIPRKRMFSHTLCLTTNDYGYLELKSTPISQCSEKWGYFNGDFSAKNHLFKITKDFTLCDKLNGISEARGSCSNYAEGKCKGACIQKETVEDYNIRVMESLNKYSLKNKDIVLVDKGRELGENAAILIKKGSLVGVGYYDLNHQINNIHILETLITPINGTQNANFIIESYLRKKKTLKTIPL
ncbi:exonuclease domain-containing protein [Maribacter sp. PR1]|uniref:Exonuclease domain-containing protein n=1 Tax=Maribacter cobaltidurans TaxID=1178778 RepID=A0ABU7ISA4_9FLAO|nr:MULTISPECIES: exonuclease domain-containing protein [Maribacter]MDC6388329.1 exonuclease domain-containing protein [Maribacter sp. PR1]MEE1975718.1 exonuclease domain-containing protein [Maribacter cobaltidurans]